jgi:hypothetical protein
MIKLTCNHGLDRVNCPICRIESISAPKFNSKIHDLYENDLKPKNPNLEQNAKNKKEFKKDLNVQNQHKGAQFTRNIHNVELGLNPIPDFRNRMFEERMKEIDIVNSKNYEYIKKKEVIEPVFKFLNEDDES